jgi:hypothetical protein
MAAVTAEVTVPDSGGRSLGARLRVPPVMGGVLGYCPCAGLTSRPDVLAGITLAAVGIPVALGYAKIAGMPVVTGLDTLLFPDGRHRNPRPHLPPQAGARGPAQ